MISLKKVDASTIIRVENPWNWKKITWVNGVRLCMDTSHMRKFKKRHPVSDDAIPIPVFKFLKFIHYFVIISVISQKIHQSGVTNWKNEYYFGIKSMQFESASTSLIYLLNYSTLICLRAGAVSEGKWVVLVMKLCLPIFIILYFLNELILKLNCTYLILKIIKSSTKSGLLHCVQLKQ